MDWTDVHYRQLARCISKHTWLYTEMVVDQTVLHTDRLDKYNRPNFSFAIFVDNHWHCSHGRGQGQEEVNGQK